MPKTVTVPALDHDAMMLSRFSHKVSVNGRLERRIVAHLCDHLADNGFTPIRVEDGEATIPAADTKAVMEQVFNLDDAWVFFTHEHAIRLVMGNGEDIISDWTFYHDDRDGFNAAMLAFDIEAIA